jgi:hypothetical protein
LSVGQSDHAIATAGEPSLLLHVPSGDLVKIVNAAVDFDIQPLSVRYEVDDIRAYRSLAAKVTLFEPPQRLP